MAGILRLENYSYIGSTNAIGHGNPATLESLRILAKLAGITQTNILLEYSAIPAQVFHSLMSKVSWVREGYTQESENLRSSFVARAFATLSFLELVVRLKTEYAESLNQPINWIAVQEHPVLGADPRILDWLGIEHIWLHVPDVNPKDSAVLAAEKLKDRLTMQVWNQDAELKLQEKGVTNVEVVQPTLLDAYRPQTPEFMRQGKQVVIKSSGSGMPKLWSQKLKSALPEAALHLPKGHTFYDVERFYYDLGGCTQLLIAHPSEITQVAASMRTRGIPLHFVVLPPRGNHEMQNLVLGVETGLITHIVDFKDGSLPNHPDLKNLIPVIPEQLGQLLLLNPSHTKIADHLGENPVFTPKVAAPTY